MKELLIMAKSLGGGGSEVALIELINALPEELYNITLVLLDSDNEYAYILFVDSDDWIANNMVEVLVHGMESSEDVDAVFCG